MLYIWGLLGLIIFAAILFLFLVSYPFFLSKRRIPYITKLPEISREYVKSKEAIVKAEEILESDTSWMRDTYISGNTLQKDKRLQDYFNTREILADSVYRHKDQAKEADNLLRKMEQRWIDSHPQYTEKELRNFLGQVRR